MFSLHFIVGVGCFCMIIGGKHVQVGNPRIPLKGRWWDTCDEGVEGSCTWQFLAEKKQHLFGCTSPQLFEHPIGSPNHLVDRAFSVQVGNDETSPKTPGTLRHMHCRYFEVRKGERRNLQFVDPLVRLGKTLIFWPRKETVYIDIYHIYY